MSTRFMAEDLHSQIFTSDVVQTNLIWVKLIFSFWTEAIVYLKTYKPVTYITVDKQ